MLTEVDQQSNLLESSTLFEPVKLLDIQRIQLPQTLNFLTRMIFYVKLNPDTAECCHQVDWLSWIPTKDLVRGIANLWGPELIQYSRVVANNFESFSERIEEFR